MDVTTRSLTELHPHKYNSMKKNILALLSLTLISMLALGQAKIPDRYLFFKGDTLDGFDFNAALRNMGIYNAQVNLSEGEKSAYMYEQEKAFMQSKLNLPISVYKMPTNNAVAPGYRVLTIRGKKVVVPRAIAINRNLIPAKTAKTINPAPLASSCQNIDWEQGDLSGWSGSMGWDDYDANPPPATPPYPKGQCLYYYGMGPLTGPAVGQNSFVGATDAAFNSSCSAVTLVTQGTDPYSNAPMVMPGGGAFSVRLGDDKVNIGATFADCEFSEQVPTQPTYNVPNTWSIKEAAGEIVMLNFAVTASNCLLTYNYNVVLNDNNHPYGQEPFFMADVVLQSDTLTPASPCSTYFQEDSAGIAPPGYSTSAKKAGGAPVFYSGWQGNTIDLSPHIGSNVIVMFYMAGCVPGGHFGYAYVDGSCGPLVFPSASPTVCAGKNQVISAPPTPPGTTYTWTGPGIVGPNTGASITVNLPGTYSVTYSLPPPNRGCPITISANVVFYPTPTIAPTSANPNCNGGNTGWASAAASGGGTPYTWNWTTSNGTIGAGQGTANATSMTAGTYTATLSNTNGCTDTHIYTLSDPAAITTTPHSANSNCGGSCTGSAGVNPASGGTGALSYSWTPAGPNASSQTNLCTGNYTCVVTDTKGCTSSSTFSIVAPAALAITPSQTNETCGTPVGSATVNASGGTGTLTYTWSPGNPTGQGTSTITNLISGNYTCLVNDGGGCSKSQVFTITGPPSPLVVAPTSTNVNCNAACTGTASAAVSGGTAPYSYSWSNAATGNVSTATALCAGSYSCDITDKQGCKTTQAYTISQSSPIVITGTGSTQTGCGTLTGTADVSVSGGSPGYTYTWSPTPTAGNGNPHAGGLGAGSYTLTVNDSKSCPQTYSVTISAAGGPSLTLATVQPKCGGTCNGSAVITTTGGTTPYVYSWSGNPSTTNSISAVCPGSYICTVTDKNNCTVTQNVTITSPATLTAAPSSTPASCGTASGTASANPSGGTVGSGYTYSWSPGSPTGQGTSSVSGLTGGTYTVLVTDINGCSATATVVVTNPGAPAATSIKTNPVCNGSCIGRDSVTASGGTGPYSYSWSGNPSTTNVATGLCSSTAITCTVTDSKGCSVSVTDSMISPPSIVVQPKQTNALCNAACNGVAIAIASGGAGGYTYSWTGNISTVDSATGLCPASSYTCTVFDSKGCSTTQAFTISQPGVLTITPSVTNVSCGGGADGTAHAIVSGGTAGFTYTWSPAPTGGQGTSTATGLPSGNIDCTVTDANGCSAVLTFTVNQPVPVVATTTPTSTSCNLSNGSAATAASGGTPGYTYTWNPAPGGGQGTATATGLGANTYTCTVADSKGCVTSTTTIIAASTNTINAHFHPSVLTGSSPLPVVFTDSSTINPVSWTWTFGDGSAGSTVQNPNHTFANPGTYTVTETVTDANGCKSVFTKIISVHELPSWIIVPNVFTPNGDGHNDNWAVESQGIATYDAKVYDRWGVMMSDLKAPGTGWDGRTVGGELAVPGTYYYIIHATGDDGKVYDFKGFLMMIRE
jgi:gliding motility-associated-like protein